MAYARIQDNKVVEIIQPIPGFPLDQCYHPDLVKNMVGCGPEVQHSWTYDSETGQFTAPVVEEPVVEETPPAE